MYTKSPHCESIPTGTYIRHLYLIAALSHPPPSLLVLPLLCYPFPTPPPPLSPPPPRLTPPPSLSLYSPSPFYPLPLLPLLFSLHLPSPSPLVPPLLFTLPTSSPIPLPSCLSLLPPSDCSQQASERAAEIHEQFKR